MDKIELQKLIGKRIVELRTQKGFSQSDLARACNKDRQSIERMENGKVSDVLGRAASPFVSSANDEEVGAGYFVSGTTTCFGGSLAVFSSFFA